MTNTFFEMHQSPEQNEEVYRKWLVVTREEQEKLNAPKSCIYVSVEEIDLIQDALMGLVSAYVETGTPTERKIMQMGYGLEEIKHKLKQRKSKSNGK